MFTLKFFNFYEDESSSCTVVCCPHYEVYHRSNGSITVSVYKNLLKTDGVEYHVCQPSMAEQFVSETKHFYHECCYIENMEGKTIDVVRPKGNSNDQRSWVWQVSPTRFRPSEVRWLQSRMGSGCANGYGATWMPELRAANGAFLLRRHAWNLFRVQLRQFVFRVITTCRNLLLLRE